jgi:hypothetical protein
MGSGRPPGRACGPGGGLGAACAAEARVDAAVVARLDAELTPVGAERAGDAQGAIPAWSGGLTAAPACHGGSGTRYCEPFPDDRPLLTVTAATLAAHEARLSAGQIALLRKYPDSYRMPVYPTRRSFANPEFVYAATRANALRAELQANGEALVGAATGVPFPIPANAYEVMWNHRTRWRDIAVRRWNNQFAVPPSGDYNQTRFREDRYQAYSRPGLGPEAAGPVLHYLLRVVTAPQRLEGAILLVHETLDPLAEARGTWQYSPGQQRLRKAPATGYDLPAVGADGLRTLDQADMFNGPMDRYDWKLTGKQTLYVPANSYRLHSDTLRYSDIVRKQHIDQEHSRYELRRVWVVESTLRPGSAHRYQRRRYYIDEDGWQVRVVDVYDARGELWQLQEAHTVIAYDKPYELPVCETVYDLRSSRYLVQGLDNEDAETVSQSFDAGHFEPGKVARLAGK